MLAAFALLLLSALVLLSSASAYDWNTGNTSVWLSAAAYCDTTSYLTRTFKGSSSGFIPKYVILETSYDTQGYVGIMPSQQAIYVVFRGSTSMKDWIMNIDDILTNYPYCSGCEVHLGWSKTEQAVLPQVRNYVAALRKAYPTYGVVVTGHSLGAALSTLVTLDLMMLDSITNIRMFNFGSPRVGNTAFANWASSKIVDRNRNTHYKDMVPHVPMHERFTHISGEWYQDVETFVYPNLRACSGLEDPTCSYQWHFTSISDHMWYLGVYLGCDFVSR